MTGPSQKRKDGSWFSPTVIAGLSGHGIFSVPYFKLFEREEWLLKCMVKFRGVLIFFPDVYYRCSSMRKGTFGAVHKKLFKTNDDIS